MSIGNLKLVKEFDNLSEMVIDNNKDKLADKMVEKLRVFLKQELFGFWSRNLLTGQEDDTFELLRYLAKPDRKGPSFNKNYRTKNFISDHIPELSNNRCLKNVLVSLFEIKQKGVGAGEVLFSLLMSDLSKPEGKIGDYTYTEGNRRIELELKALTSAASCKTNSDSRFQFSNDNFERIFEQKKTKGNDQIMNATTEQWHEYMSGLYPECYEYEKFEAIHKTKDNKEKRQMIGALGLKRYKQIDNFDSLVALKPNEKEGDLEVICINDFEDYDFINKNLSLSPSLYRGRGTQAVGDGYIDIRYKRGE